MKSFIQYLKEATTPIRIGVLVSDFEKALTPLVGKEVTPEQVGKTVEKLSKKYFFSTTIKKAPGLNAGQTSIIGFYDIAADKEFQKNRNADYPIELFLIFSTKEKKISFRPEDISSLADGIGNTLQHELLHASQAKARNYKRIGHKKRYVYKVDNIKIGSYLARDDEIEAYALNIAVALKNHFHTQQERFAFLKRPKAGIIAVPQLDQYLSMFGSGHPVVKRLFKKIVGFLKNEKL
jgi:hypothetical protein